jgi:hypothetical protein
MYRWKNISKYLSKFIKNKENPMKYNINNDLRALINKPNKIPGFINYTLNNSLNNIDNSKFPNSPKTTSNKIK